LEGTQRGGIRGRTQPPLHVLKESLLELEAGDRLITDHRNDAVQRRVLGRRRLLRDDPRRADSQNHWEKADSCHSCFLTLQIPREVPPPLRLLRWGPRS